MIVLRIQNAGGNGPYINSPQELYTQLNTNNDELSTPQNDSGIDRMPKYNEYCGFVNQQQLENWFNDYELELCEQFGYFIVEIEATITAYGKQQVLFVY